MTRINFSTDEFDPDDINIICNDLDDSDDSDSTNKANSSKRDSRERRKTRNERRKSEKENEEINPPFLIRFFSDRRVHNFIGVTFILIATFIMLASISHISNGSEDQSLINNNTINEIANGENNAKNIGGAFGAYISQLALSQWLGLGSFILILYIGLLGLSMLSSRRFKFWPLTFKCLISSIALSILLGLITYSSNSPLFWGGSHGYYVNHFLITTSGMLGAILVNVLIIALVIFIFLNDIYNLYIIYRKNIAHLKQSDTDNDGYIDSNNAPEPSEEIRQPKDKQKSKQKQNNKSLDNTSEDEILDISSSEKSKIVLDSSLDDSENENNGNVSLHVNAATIEVADEIVTDVYDPTAELSRYRFPSIDLLTKRQVKKNSVDQQEQEENKERITKTLRDYAIEISHIEATVGPTVTLYEIIPAEGVRIAKIKRLEDDIALSLAALGIRIIAPIPGKGTIGIEVPNKDPQVVSFRSIIESKKFQECKYALPIAMGATISNDVFIADLTKMPHLLVAGATGQGKSVGLNAIIASLLYKKHPAELKFVLIDPKMVEFSLYSKLERHYLAKLPDEEEAIITDPLKVVTTLNSLCVEMDNRYNLLKNANVRSIAEYNAKFIARKLNPEKGHKYLPYIVMIVDEFADLIMTAGKEVETPIARIAQKARAVGMHMIIATQRPSTNVITGIIKANFPGRTAFRVSQMVDSRTILDCTGANQLIGRGDMLFSHNGDIQRVQCAFIDTPEVEAICDCIDEQIGYEHAYYLPEYIPDVTENTPQGGGGSGFDRDPLFEEAARFIINSKTASTSSLQRRYSIGYNRAGKIMDQMEVAGIVGPAQGGKPRQVLMDSIQLEHYLSGF